MYAIVSLLEETAYQRVEAIWKKLEAECGLAGIKTTPFPHFSWQVADEYALEPLERTLKQISAKSVSMKVLVAGLGIFTGPGPVIYIPVVKDETLLRYHQMLWEEALPFASKPSLHYSPSTWVPHITLAHSDVDADKLACALRDLAVQPLSWEMKIDNLALVCQTGKEVGSLTGKFDFAK